jgi:hypothetical protein
MALSQYLKKPDSGSYFKLSSNKGKNYYFLSLETAQRVFEIQRNSVTNTEWTLYQVESGNIKVLDFIKKRERAIDQKFLIKEKKKEFELNDMLKHLAGEEVRPIKRLN